jgi:hypothetical protein
MGSLIEWPDILIVLGGFHACCYTHSRAGRLLTDLDTTVRRASRARLGQLWSADLYIPQVAKAASAATGSSLIL